MRSYWTNFVQTGFRLLPQNTSQTFMYSEWTWQNVERKTIWFVFTSITHKTLFPTGTLYEFQHRKIVADLHKNKNEIYVMKNTSQGNIISIDIPIQSLGKFCYFSIEIITPILSSIRHTAIMLSPAFFSIAPNKNQGKTALRNNKLRICC